MKRGRTCPTEKKMKIAKRGWRERADWRRFARALAWQAQARYRARWAEVYAWEATYEAAAEEYQFERHNW